MYFIYVSFSKHWVDELKISYVSRMRNITVGSQYVYFFLESAY